MEYHTDGYVHCTHNIMPFSLLFYVFIFFFLHVSSFIYRYFFAFSKLQLGCGLSDIIKVIFDLI